MAKIPRHFRTPRQAQQLEPFIPSDIADVGGGLEAQALGEIGQGIGQIGKVLFELETRKIDANDIEQSVMASTIRQKAKDDQTKFEAENQFSTEFWDTNRKTLWEQADTQIGELSFSDKVKEKQNLIHAAEKQHDLTIGQVRTTGISIENAITSSGAAYIASGSVDALDAPELRDQYKEALELEHTPSAVELMLKEADLEVEKNRIANLVRAGEFAEATELASTTKAFDDDPEKRNALLKSIESEQNRVKRKTQDIKHSQQMVVNEDFTNRIFTQDLSPDEVAESNLDEKPPAGIGGLGQLTKKQWLRYVEGASDPPPKTSEPDAYVSTTDAVFDFIGNKKTKEATFRAILSARYEQKSITDVDYKWAIDKVNNPYDKPVATDLNATIQDNLITMRGIGFFDKQRFNKKEKAKADSVNRSLVDWVDKQITDGKTPTREDMQNQAAILIANNGENIDVINTPKTQKDYDKLPSGAKYLDPATGRIRRKN